MGAGFSTTTLKVKLKSAVQRMNMQINKKNNQIRIDSKQIAQLLTQKKDESARIRVEGILHEKNLVTVMETLVLMCELLAARAGLIAAQKECPDDLTEAIATIIYCSKRVEIPELTEIGYQFASKFGKDWAMSHVQNDSKRVNKRLMEKLAITPPPFEIILSSMVEIAEQYQIDWKPTEDDPAQRLGSVAPIDDTPAQQPTQDVKTPAIPKDAIVATGDGVYPGTMNVLVLQARDLTNPSGETINAYIQLTSTNGSDRHTSRTKVLTKSGSNPKWSTESFPFRVNTPEAKLTVEVFHDASKGSDVLLGTTILSLDLLRQNPDPKWYRLGRDADLRADAGFVLLASQYMAVHKSTSPIPSLPTASPNGSYQQSPSSSIPFASSPQPQPMIQPPTYYVPPSQPYYDPSQAFSSPPMYQQQPMFAPNGMAYAPPQVLPSFTDPYANQHGEAFVEGQAETNALTQAEMLASYAKQSPPPSFAASSSSSSSSSHPPVVADQNEGAPTSSPAPDTTKKGPPELEELEARFNALRS